MIRIMAVATMALSFAAFPAGADSTAEIAAVKQAVQRAMPDSKPDAIVPAPFAGFYEVGVGAQIFYVSADGKLLIDGELYDLQSRRNLTDDRKSIGRKKIVDAIDESTMVVFAPKDVKYTVTVFTDIDCGYCRKLHNEIRTYTDRGIKVRYAAFPRSGKDTPSYYKAVGVWCAKDRKTAMTNAKLGGTVEEKKCDNPVDEHLEAGISLGVSGTPTMVFSNGHVVPGYVNAGQLVQLLEKENPGSAANN
jgi:thiol:disulfide interchange protein DsbC